MNELLISTVPAAILSIITFLLTRRKYIGEVKQANAQAEGNEIENVERVAKIWRELSEDLKVKLSAEIETLRQENSTMKQELSGVQKQFLQVLNENEDLRNQMASLEKELKSSKSQIKNLSDQNRNLLLELKKFNKNYDENKPTCNFPETT